MLHVNMEIYLTDKLTLASCVTNVSTENNRD